MGVEQRLEELGLVLPGPPEVPPGFKFPFRWVRVWDGKAYVSGHSAQAPDGSFTGPFGKQVPSWQLRLGSVAQPGRSCGGEWRRVERQRE
jgi:hypothetical protein